MYAQRGLGVGQVVGLLVLVLIVIEQFWLILL
jgi:hypothetical protein